MQTEEMWEGGIWGGRMLQGIHNFNTTTLNCLLCGAIFVNVCHSHRLRCVHTFADLLCNNDNAPGAAH